MQGTVTYITTLLYQHAVIVREVIKIMDERE